MTAGGLIAVTATVVSTTPASAIQPIGCKGAGGPHAIPGGGISFADASHGWVVGSMKIPALCQSTGAILATRDGGMTWTGQSIPDVSSLAGVAFGGASTGWAVGGTGGTGIVLGTSDGGNTWTAQTTVTGSGALTAVAAVGTSDAWAVGYQAVVATTNGGATWASQMLPASIGMLDGVAFASTTVGWAVGQISCMSFPCPAGIIATTNGGTTWTAQTAPGAVENLESVAALTTTTAWASGEDCTGTPCAGVLLETSDGGTTWNRPALPAGMGQLRQVVFTDANHGWAIGDTSTGAGVLVTTNGGVSWTEHDLPTFAPTPYRGLAFTSTSQGWASATPDVAQGPYTSGGIVATTSDGGTTWSTESLPSVRADAIGLAVTNASTAWVTGQTCSPFGLPCKSAVFATANGGGTWAGQTLPAASGDGPMNGVSFVNATTGWAVGQCTNVPCPPSILATTNGGATWISESVPAGVAQLSDVAFVSPTVGWASGGCSTPMCSGTILATTNGGATWTAQTVPADVAEVSDLFFLNSTTGWAVTQNCAAFPCIANLLSTNNGGATWTESAISGLATLEDVVFINSTTGWLVGQTNVGPGSAAILATTDGGGTWTYQSTLANGGVLFGVDFANASDGWAVGLSQSGSIYVATIVRTINGGATWSPVPVPGQLGTISGGELFAVKFADASHGWAVGAIQDQAVFLRTVDGGVTWFAQPGLGPPTGVTALPGDREATLTWTPPFTVSTIASYTVTTSPGGATTTVKAVVPAATITGLTNGTAYTFTVAANTAAGTGPPSPASAPVTPTAVALGSPVAVLPAMSNLAYGGYLTTAYLENLGAAPAHIRVQYFNQSGGAVGFGNSAAGLTVGATWTLRTDNGDSLGALQAGSAVVSSDQPLATFVNEFAPGGGDATSYTGISPTATGTTLYAPTIVNNAYGGYTTGIGLINAGSNTTQIGVVYRDLNGVVLQTQSFTGFAPGAYMGLYSGDPALALPAGFAGTATITSSVSAIAAVINETGPGGQFSSYDAVSAGSATLYAPATLDNAFGGFYTGMGIQNTTAAAGTVTITYYDSAGTLAATTTHPIAANGSVGVYQGTDLTTPGAYTAKISSTVAIAAIVNEVAPSATSAKQSTAYNTFASGSAPLHLPLVESNGSDGWATGEGIMNTGSAPTTVQVSYQDTTTGASIGTIDVVTLQPNAFWGLYQPAGGLPAGARASAVITTSPGGQVAVVCNESNATSFMSYTGQ